MCIQVYKLIHKLSDIYFGLLHIHVHIISVLSMLQFDFICKFFLLTDRDIQCVIYQEIGTIVIPFSKLNVQNNFKDLCIVYALKIMLF